MLFRSRLRDSSLRLHSLEPLARSDDGALALDAAKLGSLSLQLRAAPLNLRFVCAVPYARRASERVPYIGGQATRRLVPSCLRGASSQSSSVVEG